MSSVSRRDVLAGGAAAALLVSVPSIGNAAVTAFMQAVAEAASNDRDIAAFYRANGYKPIWTGTGNRDKQRRQSFIKAVSQAGDHGLPAGRYSPDLIETNLRGVQSQRDLGRLEVELSRLFLRYARDVQTGILAPSRVDEQIVRQVPLRSREQLLDSFSKSTPAAYFKALPPKSDEYKNLMKEKLRLEKVIGSGDWGAPVQAKKLELGNGGNAVVALRNRLIRMGYLKRTSQSVYDDKMMKAVAAFQHDHGLTPDGVAGPSTVGEINTSAATRLSQVIVAMERERWINHPNGRGDRHVWVNLTDFRTKLYDKGRVTFETKSVVGERLYDKRTPEFSDQMEYMEINPDWTVPRSILGRDYLPKLKQDPNAARYLQLIDVRGRVVSRESIDFSQYTEHNFPFTVRQPPGRANALGTVKFMFPNPHAIYLHDTPQRHLFQREVRAYSSGCIRLHDPHDFAYILLRRQMKNPESYFQNILASGKQTIVPLDTPVPVHLDYRTAFTEPKRRTQFRRDIYGRDARIWKALENAGVALRAVRG
ncbi:L,D-transpeptidase family protein [Ovoidimarina sediminis]|uniref:L,D-transpeptidase family protein n=1 Tax=Ovoidimarina sediminis TaxID=3079856 RepID=UPI0029080E3D|nr:L,D-transpeptidase family protein [Rhodophyticola sp. MJ-SS7]MDU8942158.1 L,D-transpeptidase family protein [Rhodophyticola sp. MJ-SS7]